MRWGTSDFAWVRPLARILCVLDGKPVRFALAHGEDAVPGLAAADLTEGHRVLAGTEPFAVRSFAEYERGLRARFVVADAAERERSSSGASPASPRPRGWRWCPTAGCSPRSPGWWNGRCRCSAASRRLYGPAAGGHADLDAGEPAVLFPMPPGWRAGGALRRGVQRRAAGRRRGDRRGQRAGAAGAAVGCAVLLGPGPQAAAGA